MVIRPKVEKFKRNSKTCCGRKRRSKASPNQNEEHHAEAPRTRDLVSSWQDRSILQPSSRSAQFEHFAIISANSASLRESIEAEGMGLDPTTPFGAPHFQSEPTADVVSDTSICAPSTCDASAEAVKASGNARVTIEPSTGGHNRPDNDELGDGELEM